MLFLFNKCFLLNIKGKNIFILLDKIKEKKIKIKNYKIIEGILTYKPEYCSCCGVVNQSHGDIIKLDFRKNCKIKIPKIANCYSLLILHKQRFLCKNCNNTFITETSIVKRNKRKYSSYSKIADNHINHEFYAEKSNQKWYTDVTEFNLRGVKCYLSPILNGFNGGIVF